MSAEPGPSSAGPVPARRRTVWGRELAAFCATALLVLIAVSAGTVWLSERIARANALEEAERTAQRLAQFLIEPALTEAPAGAVRRARRGRGEPDERRVGRPHGRLAGDR
jgi:two-component system, NarL family, sensor kinase